MARAVLPSSILVVVLLFHFQVADSSARPLSTEEQQRRPRVDPTAPAASAAAVHYRAEPHHLHRDAAETGTGHVAVETTARRALSATTTTTSSARGKGEQGDGDHGVASRNDNRPADAVLLRRRSWLARRFLLEGVVEGAESAAKPSCRSSDVHIGCTPASEH